MLGLLLKKSIVIFVALFLVFLIFPNKTLAILSTDPSPVYQNSKSLTVTYKSDTPNTFLAGEVYTVGFWQPGSKAINASDAVLVRPTRIDDKTITASLKMSDNILKGFNRNFEFLEALGGPLSESEKINTTAQGDWTVKIWKGRGGQDFKDANMILPELKTLETGGTYRVYPPSGPGGIGLPGLEMNNNVFQYNTTAILRAVNIDPNQDYMIWFSGDNALFSGKFSQETLSKNSKGQTVATMPINVGATGRKTLCLRQGVGIANLLLSNTIGLDCDFSLNLLITALQPTGTPTPVFSNYAGIPEGENCDPDLQNDPEKACPQGTNCVLQISDNSKETFICKSKFSYDNASYASLTCAEGEIQKKDENGKIVNTELITRKQIEDNPSLANSITKCLSVNTAIGPISTDPQAFVRYIFGIILGLAGGIALLLIILSGARMMASQGNAEQVTAARDQFTSAIIGLLFIIFSFVILQIIGVDILRIPGFSK